MTREELIAMIDDWPNFTPAGEYTTIRKVLSFLVDITVPMVVEDFDAMVVEIKKDPTRERVFYIEDDGIGHQKITYSWKGAPGLFWTAEVFQKSQEEILS